MKPLKLPVFSSNSSLCNSYCYSNSSSKCRLKTCSRIRLKHTLRKPKKSKILSI